MFPENVKASCPTLVADIGFALIHMSLPIRLEVILLTTRAPQSFLTTLAFVFFKLMLFELPFAYCAPSPLAMDWLASVILFASFRDQLTTNLTVDILFFALQRMLIVICQRCALLTITAYFVTCHGVLASRSPFLQFLMPLFTVMIAEPNIVQKPAFAIFTSCARCFAVRPMHIIVLPLHELGAAVVALPQVIDRGTIEVDFAVIFP
jgi:hypothetical protein